MVLLGYHLPTNTVCIKFTAFGRGEWREEGNFKTTMFGSNFGRRGMEGAKNLPNLILVPLQNWKNLEEINCVD